MKNLTMLILCAVLVTIVSAGFVGAATMLKGAPYAYDPQKRGSVYDDAGLKGSDYSAPLRKLVQGVSDQRRLQHFVPSDLRPVEGAKGTIENTVSGKLVKTTGSNKGNFGWPPAGVEAAPRLGGYHRQETPKLLNSAKNAQESYANPVSMKQIENSVVCCNKRLLLRNNGIRLGECKVDLASDIYDVACKFGGRLDYGPCTRLGTVPCAVTGNSA